jgi:hypothetical protein
MLDMVLKNMVKKRSMIVEWSSHLGMTFLRLGISTYIYYVPFGNQNNAIGHPL